MRMSPWLASLALLTLGGCVNGVEDRPPGPPPATPTEQFAIEVRPTAEELKLAPHATGLSPNQVGALDDFVRGWNGAGDVTVKAPEHGADPAEAYRTATDARDFLIAHGVAAAKVRIVGYEADGDGHAPVVLTYARYEARGPRCGHGWGNLAAVNDNREYAEFGCALTANMAAQLAEPADVLHPRESTPMDAGRRETALEKYRQGAITSTPKDPQADGTLVTVGH
ncbi:MAG: CpaD family pilus assembly protein [Caulobacteraceae bacterium]|nr:CpaD family pilus assembly protein [Caulobacteraceae bacterium]